MLYGYAYTDRELDSGPLLGRWDGGTEWRKNGAMVAEGQIIKRQSIWKFWMWRGNPERCLIKLRVRGWEGCVRVTGRPSLEGQFATIRCGST